MYKAFKNHIASRLGFLKKGRLLIAISGGLDSVVLTHLCSQINLDVSLAHCNFNLRGDESDGDESFVLELAEQLEMEVFIESFETEAYAETQKMSIQMAARELRYNWFEELAKQLKFDFILTAHHADDNLETFLINLTRGTGLDGLTGIPTVNKNIVRPLLPYSRETIERYAKEKKIKWREDSSNTSTKYLRNRLRHDVIPVLKEVNPQLLQGFDKTLNNLQDASNVVKESVDAVKERVIERIEGDVVTYDVSEFKKLSNPRPYIFEIFKEYGFTAFEDIYDLLNAQSGKQVFSSTHRLLKNRGGLILTVINLASTETIEILEGEKVIETSFGTLLFEEVNTVSKTSEKEIFVDAKTLRFPLEVRGWKGGDLFYPMGLQGKKKLSKFFKDEKLSLLDKEKCQLLCSNGEVVWVINYRADNRFKVTENTNRILKVTLQG